MAPEEEHGRRRDGTADATAQFFPASGPHAPWPPDGRPPPRWAARSVGRAGPGWRTRKQTGRGWGDSPGTVSPAQALVAWRSPSSAPDIATGAADLSRSGLVRGPCRPALQPPYPTLDRGNGGPVVAAGSAL